MTPAVWGGVLAGTTAWGLVLVVVRWAAVRRPSLASRVLPFLQDLPLPSDTVRTSQQGTSTNVVAGIFGPWLGSAADLVERVLGGSASVQRRLARAGRSMTVQEFRAQQVLWGLAGFGFVAAIHLLRSLSGGVSPWSALVLSIVGLVAGVMLRDNRLSGEVRRREQEILAEFPTVAELLALSVAAGESPVAALDRVVRRCRGALSEDLAGVLAEIRTGEPVALAFERLAASTGLALVARFASGIAVALERGTPLAQVLHAQAADVREAGRRQLIESAARKEVLMMAPVVFLVLPVTIVFAFFPGAIGLRLVIP